MNNELIQIATCEVCNNTELYDVLNLGLHPMCDDLIAVGDANKCKEYPIEIVYCRKCNTAHQKFQIPKRELFPDTYHYRSRFTTDVLNGMKALVADCKSSFGSLAGKKILDIGCNDGSLLDFFKNEGTITFGIEPTDAYKDAQLKGHSVVNDYLSFDTACQFVENYGKPDIITFTNVFAHIEDLKGVITSLKELMSENTVIIIENHYLGAVIEKKQFDTFYHEHPRTYSYNSFLYIAQALEIDLLNVEFPSRYGGNIRVVMGKSSSYPQFELFDSEILKSEGEFYQYLVDMNKDIDVWKVEMKSKLASLVSKYGKLKAKAFPGRAAILVKLLDLDVETISCVYEKPGSMKIGHYVPGTRIPIRSDEELFQIIENEKCLVNLAWHIKDEIGLYLNSKGFKGELVNIL